MTGCLLGLGETHISIAGFAAANRERVLRRKELFICQTTMVVNTGLEAYFMPFEEPQVSQ